MSTGEALKLLHITDLHLYADPGAEIYGVQTDVSLRAVLEQALGNDPRPDAILITGDLVEDHSRPGYERLREILEPVNLPVMCLPGNHDDPGLIREVLNDGNFSCCSYRDFGNWRLVLLDSHVGGADFGLLSDSELARLEQTLESAGERHVLVAVHHQPVPVGSPWLDGVGLQNGADLISIVQRYQQTRLLVWGHVHQEFEEQQGQVRLMCTPSTCAQFSPRTEKCLMDVRPPGYRLINLGRNGAVDAEVFWLDHWEVAERPPDSRAI